MRQVECRAFTTKFNARVNRILSDVLISAAYDPQNPPKDAKHYATKALWDTGATHSVITENTAKELGLQATGKKIVHHAGGQGNYNTHVVHFFLPNKVCIAGVLVSECPDIGEFGAIIGMDIISGGDLAITNHQGQTWITFRWPSIGSMDYVAEFNQQRLAAVPRVGRNDPCPCGSGKKYKKCHGVVA